MNLPYMYGVLVGVVKVAIGGGNYAMERLRGIPRLLIRESLFDICRRYDTRDSFLEFQEAENNDSKREKT